MSDDANVKPSEPAEEKEDSKKRNEETNPKQHGSEVHRDVEDDGRTNTTLGSTEG